MILLVVDEVNSPMPLRRFLAARDPRKDQGRWNCTGWTPLEWSGRWGRQWDVFDVFEARWRAGAQKKETEMSHVSRQAADDGRLVYVGNLNDDVRERCVPFKASAVE